MVRRRKTKREREDERYQADRRAWEEFRPKFRGESGDRNKGFKKGK